MRSLTRSILLLIPLTLLAPASGSQAAPAPSADIYSTLPADLAGLRQDFNAGVGKVRLLYIVGASCPVCLRGMDDLGRALAPQQDDPRLRTLVVYVPELHAVAADIAPTVSLLPGKQVSRYWDPAGASEKTFESILKTPGSAWDVYMVYGPEQRWDGALPPQPDFWMAQLGGIPSSRYLDAAEFAKQVQSRLASLKAGGA